jgi:hypothetical protein
MSNGFDGSQLQAEKGGSSSKPDESVGGCPEWTITVTVKSSVDYWPKEEVQVWLYLMSGNVQDVTKLTKMETPTAPPVSFKGHGPQRYSARASTRTAPWKFTEKEIEVTSEDLAVELVLEPKPWIAVKVIDATTKTRIGGAKVKVTLGGEAKPGEVTSTDKDENRNVEMIHFERDGVSKVTGLTHADDVWEVDSVTSE